MGRSKAVLDAAAFLNSISFHFPFEDVLTVPEVLDEVKTKAPVVEALVSEGKIHVKAPAEEYVKRVRTVSEEIGELRKLSETDILVLALALQENAVVITDDFHVQNVATELKIPFQGVTEEIREKRVWRKKCTRCGKIYPPTYRGKRCPICGGKLVYFSK